MGNEKNIMNDKIIELHQKVFNNETHNPNNIYKFTPEFIENIMLQCNHSILDGLILGIAEKIVGDRRELDVCGECYDISIELIKELNKLNIPSNLESGYFQIDFYDECDDVHPSLFLYRCDPLKLVHHWVKVNGKILDATYGQFIRYFYDTNMPNDYTEIYPSQNSYLSLVTKDIDDLPYIVYDNPIKLSRYNISDLTDDYDDYLCNSSDIDSDDDNND